MKPVKICLFDACLDRLADNGICPVWVSEIVALFGHWTVGPLDISVMSVRYGISSLLQ